MVNKKYIKKPCPNCRILIWNKSKHCKSCANKIEETHQYRKDEEYIKKCRESSRLCSMGNKYHWKNGRVLRSDKYILEYCPEHPFAVNGRYVMQHRLVMERFLGRILDPKEVVHHINNIRYDNRLENLMLLSGRGEHNTLHKKGKHKVNEVIL